MTKTEFYQLAKAAKANRTYQSYVRVSNCSYYAFMKQVKKARNINWEVHTFTTVFRQYKVFDFERFEDAIDFVRNYIV